MQTDHYEGAILEEIRDQNKAILEGLQPLPKMARDIETLKDDVAEIRSDIVVIKALDQDHERRIKALEAVKS